MWIEIDGAGTKRTKQERSLPSRECGLKWVLCWQHCYFEWSLPLRECGLKFIELDDSNIDQVVTPFAGVWIEIVDGGAQSITFQCHSLRGSVD